MIPTQIIHSALLALSNKIQPHADADAELKATITQTKQIFADAAERIENLAKAARGLNAGRRYWKARCKKAEEALAKLQSAMNATEEQE